MCVCARRESSVCEREMRECVCLCGWCEREGECVCVCVCVWCV